MKKKEINEAYIGLAVVGFVFIFYAAFMFITAKDTRTFPKEIFGIKIFDKADNYFQDIYVEDPAHKDKLIKAIDRIFKKSEHVALARKQVKFVINENFSENQIAMKLEKIEEEIAIESADKEKYLKDIDHIVKTGERLKLH